MTFNFTTASTHDGIFHGDDVMAAAMLRVLRPGMTISRTRNPAAIAAAEVVFDVGGVYDPEKNLFDHHQREGAPAPRENGVPFASAGLVWGKFGPEIVRRVCAGIDANSESWLNVAATVAAIDEGLLQSVDARDNGQLTVSATAKSGASVAVLVLSDVLASFNTIPLVDSEDPAGMDARFEEAVVFAERFLRAKVAQEFARQKGAKVIASAIEAAAGGAVVVLEPFVLGWQDAIVSDAPAAKFVVHPKLGGGWQAAVIPTEVGKFTARHQPPKAWWGAKPADIAALTGVTDVIFCHQGGAFFAARSREGLDKLVQLALADAN